MATLGEYGALVLALRDRLGLNALVETGSYEGASTRWAAENFARTVSIEISPKFMAQAIHRCEGLANVESVEFILGDSRTELTRVVSSLEAPALFWLDAHNAAKLFGPGPDNCPVLSELAAIAASDQRHVILIDDAHTFSDPPMYENWPTLREIDMWAIDNEYNMIIYRDVVILVHTADTHAISNLPT